MSKHRIHWDHYFSQWLAHALPRHDLVVEEKPQFSQLPLEADILVIAASQAKLAWQKHPLWRYLSPYTVIEFKSVADPFRDHDLETLSAYVALTHRQHQLALQVQVGGWLVVSRLNKSLRQRLQNYGIELQNLFPGFWQAETTFFPLVVVAYEELPNTPDYFELKTFMRGGKELQETLRMGLQQLAGSNLQNEYLTIISAIHKQEAEAVIQVLESEKENVAWVVEQLLEKSPELGEKIPFIQAQKSSGWLNGKQEGRQEGRQEGKREGQRETARQMKADGLPVASICKYTGLSTEEVAGL